MNVFLKPLGGEDGKGNHPWYDPFGKGANIRIPDRGPLLTKLHNIARGGGGALGLPGGLGFRVDQHFAGNCSGIGRQRIPKSWI